MAKRKKKKSTRAARSQKTDPAVTPPGKPTLDPKWFVFLLAAVLLLGVVVRLVFPEFGMAISREIGFSPRSKGFWILLAVALLILASALGLAYLRRKK
jgi:hypothetical protein